MKLTGLLEMEPSWFMVQLCIVLAALCTLTGGMLLYWRTRKLRVSATIPAAEPVQEMDWDTASSRAHSHPGIYKLSVSSFVMLILALQFVAFGVTAAIFRSNFDEAVQSDFVGDPLGSILALKRARRTPFGHSVIHLYLGREYMNAHRLSDALPELKEACRYVPNAEALALQGQIHFKEGRSGEAISCFMKAIQYTPGSSTYYVAYGESLQAAGRYGEAYQAYQKAALIDRTDYKPRMHLGMLLVEQGSYDEGLANARKAVDLAPSNAEAHYCLATTYARLGVLKPAISEYLRTVELSHAMPAAYLNLSFALRQLHEDERADEALKDCIAVETNKPEDIAIQKRAKALLRHNTNSL
jgi:tetratricopeptide (TPR) repeat protein